MSEDQIIATTTTTATSTDHTTIVENPPPAEEIPAGKEEGERVSVSADSINLNVDVPPIPGQTPSYSLISPHKPSAPLSTPAQAKSQAQDSVPATAEQGNNTVEMEVDPPSNITPLTGQALQQQQQQQQQQSAGKTNGLAAPASAPAPASIEAQAGSQAPAPASAQAQPKAAPHPAVPAQVLQSVTELKEEIVNGVHPTIPAPAQNQNQNGAEEQNFDDVDALLKDVEIEAGQEQRGQGQYYNQNGQAAGGGAGVQYDHPMTGSTVAGTKRDADTMNRSAGGESVDGRGGAGAGYYAGSGGDRNGPGPGHGEREREDERSLKRPRQHSPGRTSDRHSRGPEGGRRDGAGAGGGHPGGDRRTDSGRDYDREREREQRERSDRERSHRAPSDREQPQQQQRGERDYRAGPPGADRDRDSHREREGSGRFRDQSDRHSTSTYTGERLIDRISVDSRGGPPAPPGDRRYPDDRGDPRARDYDRGDFPPPPPGARDPARADTYRAPAGDDRDRDRDRDRRMPSPGGASLSRAGSVRDAPLPVSEVERNWDNYGRSDGVRARESRRSDAGSNERYMPPDSAGAPAGYDQRGPPPPRSNVDSRGRYTGTTRDAPYAPDDRSMNGPPSAYSGGRRSPSRSAIDVPNKADTYRPGQQEEGYSRPNSNARYPRTPIPRDSIPAAAPPPPHAGGTGPPRRDYAPPANTGAPVVTKSVGRNYNFKASQRAAAEQAAAAAAGAGNYDNRSGPYGDDPYPPAPPVDPYNRVDQGYRNMPPPQNGPAPNDRYYGGGGGAPPLDNYGRGYDRPPAPYDRYNAPPPVDRGPAPGYGSLAPPGRGPPGYNAPPIAAPVPSALDAQLEELKARVAEVERMRNMEKSMVAPPPPARSYQAGPPPPVDAGYGYRGGSANAPPPGVGYDAGPPPGAGRGGHGGGYRGGHNAGGPGGRGDAGYNGARNGGGGPPRDTRPYPPRDAPPTANRGQAPGRRTPPPQRRDDRNRR